MQCSYCGADLADNAANCGTCGARQFQGAPTLSSFGPPPPPAPIGPAVPRYGSGPSVLPPLAPLPGPLTPSAPMRPRRRWPVLIAIIGGPLILAAAAAAVVVVLTRSTHHYPSQWDARVAPIAARVEQLRGLTFEHPVRVEYLSVADFEKKVSASPGDLKKHKKEIEQGTALFRAAGLIGSDVDLGKAANDTQAADTIAFYDPDTKDVYVRGDGAFTIETRVTLAHELTHVLQDQHFDLNKLQKRAEDSKTGTADALTALIEGDAVHVEKQYLAEQTPADRKEYDRLSNSTSHAADARTKGIPAVVGTYFGAPYIFGPQVVSVLESSHGKGAVDAALTGPTPTTRIYFDPTAVGDAPPLPPVPGLKADEKKVSSGSANDDVFDDFTLYLMLSARLDPTTAMRAADAYSAGSEVLYTRSGTTCFRAAIDGVNPASDTFLAATLERWTASVPDAGIDSTGSTVVFHSCDPGKRAVAPHDAAIEDATQLVAARSALVEELVGKEHAPVQLATCAARLIVRLPDFRASLLGRKPAGSAAQQRREGAEAGLACRLNPLSGIP